MQSKVIRTLALALVLGGVSIVLGQQPSSGSNSDKQGDSFYGGGKGGGKGAKSNASAQQKAPPAKSKLEEMLAEALKNNPDIRVAVVKLAEADAELNRTRLQVIQKVVTLHHAILTQKAVVEVTQKKYDRVKALGQDRAVSPQMVDEASAELTVAKAKLEELEAQQPVLLGKTPQSEHAQRVREVITLYEEVIRLSPQTRGTLPVDALWEKTHKATGPMAERLRKALQTPVKVDYKKMHFPDILKDLAKKVPGLAFRNLFADGERMGIPPNAQDMSLRFEEMLPVSAILQALADESGCRFYVREYGILVTDKENAPPGAMTIEEFLRQRPADEPRRQSSGGKNAPAESVEGLIKSVDAKGLLTLSIGSDAGLAKGQTLKLFWMPHEPPIDDARSLGTVRIVEVEAHQAVVQPVGRLGRIPQPGSRIIAQIQKK